MHLLGQQALLVLGGHHGQRGGLDFAALAFATKFKVALLANEFGGFAGGFEPFAGIEFVRVFK